MLIRNLTPTGDWTFGAGLNNYLQNEAAIEMNIRTTLLSWVGNCFFSLSDYVDWYNLLGSPGQQNAIVNALKTVTLQCDGVISVNSVNLTYTPQSRIGSIQMSISTTYTPSAQIVIPAPVPL